MKDLKLQTPRPNANGKSSGRPGALTPEIQARIGHQLRTYYDEVVRQGVPERFADLIRKLDTPAAAAAMSETSGEASAEGAGTPSVEAKNEGRD